MNPPTDRHQIRCFEADLGFQGVQSEHCFYDRPIDLNYKLICKVDKSPASYLKASNATFWPRGKKMQLIESRHVTEGGDCG